MVEDHFNDTGRKGVLNGAESEQHHMSESGLHHHMGVLRWHSSTVHHKAWLLLWVIEVEFSGQEDPQKHHYIASSLGFRVFFNNRWCVQWWPVVWAQTGIL